MQPLTIVVYSRERGPLEVTLDLHDSEDDWTTVASFDGSELPGGSPALRLAPQGEGRENRATN